MAIEASDAGITALTLPYPSEQAAVDALSPGKRVERAGDERFAALITSIKRFMNGEKTDFVELLDLSAGTPFQQRVWTSCKGIPYGQTRSYSWIARDIGNPAAARAVGNALNKNPIPIIIPCHRVIAADGSLGGFGGGCGLKRDLLEMEGVSVQG
jgi:methylated-DNA-[protein]-cysteine S-methyltransferase